MLRPVSGLGGLLFSERFRNEAQIKNSSPDLANERVRL